MAKKLINSNLTVPPIVDGINRLRAQIIAADREDLAEELDAQEKKARISLLKLSARDHEGIKLLVTQAKEELRLIYQKLTEAPDLDNSEKYLNTQRMLFNQRDLWIWFLNFFDEAEESKKEVEDFVSRSALPKDGEEEDY